MQRSDLIPQINRISYLTIYSNIIDNENNPYYLSNVFIKSNVSELSVNNENSIFKKQRIINDVFNYKEIEIFDEENEKIEMTDYFSVTLYIHQLYIMPLQKLSEIEEKLQKDYIDIKKRCIKLKRCKYALLILKTNLISLSIGLSFINPLIIIASSLVPIVDSILLIIEKDKKVCDLKLQKDIINQIIKEIQIKKYAFKNDDDAEKYIIQVYGKIQNFLDI